MSEDLLVVGDALEIGEDVLDLLQTFPQAAHGEHRQLIAGVDGQDGEEPPAARRPVGSGLEQQEQRFTVVHGIPPPHTSFSSPSAGSGSLTPVVFGLGDFSPTRLMSAGFIPVRSQGPLTAPQ